MQRFHESLNSPFRAVVQAIDWKRDLSSDGCHSHDLPLSLFSKEWQCLTRHVHDAEDVRIELTLDLLRCRLLEDPDRTVPCIVQQDVDRTEIVCDGFKG